MLSPQLDVLPGEVWGLWTTWTGKATLHPNPGCEYTNPILEGPFQEDMTYPFV